MKKYRYEYVCKVENNEEITIDKVIRSNSKKLMRKYIKTHRNQMWDETGALYARYFHSWQHLYDNGREIDLLYFIEM